MNPIFVYALCEPGTRKVRYIGISNNPTRRLKDHITGKRRNRTTLGEWLRSLSVAPAMIILSRSSDSAWKEDEARYIRSARALGMPLVNSTDGGDGVTMTPATRAKISRSMSGARNHNFGKKLTKITRAKMSASKMGKSLSEIVRAHISAATTGKKRSPETCARIGRSKSGKNHPFFGLKGADSPNFGRRHSEATRRKMKISQQRRFNKTKS